MKSLNRQLQYILILCFSVVVVACGAGKEKSDDGDILVRIGDKTLTRQQLDAEIPHGILRDDSIKLARTYIRNWIEFQLISEVASKNIDMDNIDKMVEQYRFDLIMWEYSRLMFDTNADSNSQLSEDSLFVHYETNRNRYKLSSPLIKGIYIKAEDNAPRLAELKRLYISADSADVEKIEKTTLTGVVHFDYFRDRWIDWAQVEARIPIEIGASPDDYLRTHRQIEVSQGGYTYLLDISDLLTSGSVMPYEVARPIIIEEMKNSRREEFDINLRKQIYDDAISSGKIEIRCDMGI